MTPLKMVEPFVLYTFYDILYLYRRANEAERLEYLFILYTIYFIFTVGPEPMRRNASNISLYVIRCTLSLPSDRSQ